MRRVHVSMLWLSNMLVCVACVYDFVCVCTCVCIFRVMCTHSLYLSKVRVFVLGCACLREWGWVFACTCVCV